MLSNALNEALVEQIRRELDSAYVYLGMVAHFESEALPGCAHWMRMQAREELAHATKLFDFVLDRGGSVELRPLPGPKSSFGSPLETFTEALEHEQFITKSINEVYAIATSEKDFATQSHLNWFLDEQVEEEKSAQEVVDYLRRAGDDPGALLMLDQRLAERRPEAEEAGA